MKNNSKKTSIVIILLIIIILLLILGFAILSKNVNKRTFNVIVDDTNVDKDSNNSISKLKEEKLKPKSYSAVIPTYMYHWVKEDTGGYEYPEMMVKPSEIKKQFEYLSTNNYDTIFITDLNEIYNFKKPIALTFDDGWQDVYNSVFPYAKEYKIKISMYVITDLIGTPGYCTIDQLKEMRDSGLVDIQSHTVTHRELATLSNDEVYKELSESKKYLKDNLNIDTTVICYPSGSFNNSVIKIAEDLGYTYGLAMDGGIYYTNRSDKMEITRIFLTRSMSLQTFINYSSNANVVVNWE